MRRTIIAAVFVGSSAGVIGLGALDSVPKMYGSDSLKAVTASVMSQCTALGTYLMDNDPKKAGVQPLNYVGGGSSMGEVLLKLNSQQLVAPMTRALGSGTCDAAGALSTAENIVFALDALNVVFGPGVANAAGLDFTNSAGTLSPVPAPGDDSNRWRTVLREVYTGMGASGQNIFTRDCNSASRKALVADWDNLFAGSNPGNVCLDSNPDAAVIEKGLRHAFRRDEESGATDVFLAQLSLPPIELGQEQSGCDSGCLRGVPPDSDAIQTAVYRGLLNSPFCNVHRPEDDYAPVALGGSYIPPMYQVGVPTSAGPGTGFASLDPLLGASARYLSPYTPEQMDEDPIRRRCFGPKVTLGDSPNAPREEVCGADGNLGIVLPITLPTELSSADRFPSLPCEDGEFEFGPAPTRPTGDSVRCPNGDVPQNGNCLLPIRLTPDTPSGFAFDCLNNGLNSPAAVFDTDGNGSDFPDAPLTDGKLNADGRAYNLVLRAPDGTVRAMRRANPTSLATTMVPVVGAFYRLHSSRSGLLAPNHTRTCSAPENADDQIGCLVQLNPCSMGYAAATSVRNNPGTVTAAVNGVIPTTNSIQALVSGGSAYPLARKLYVNSLRGFENLLTSSDPQSPVGKDAELDFSKCVANLPFSTFSGFGSSQLDLTSYGLVPLPAPSTGGAAHAFCEDFPEPRCAIGGPPVTNVDACANNPSGLPSSACNNGYRDGDETGVDICPSWRPICDPTSHQCQ